MTNPREKVATYLVRDMPDKPNNLEVDPMVWAYKAADAILSLVAEDRRELVEAADQMLAAIRSANSEDGGDYTLADVERWGGVIANALDVASGKEAGK